MKISDMKVEFMGFPVQGKQRKSSVSVSTTLKETFVSKGLKNYS